MKILSRYIISGYVGTFIAALLIITLVLSIGAIFKMTDLLARGRAPLWPLIQVLVDGLPMVLSLAIPLASLMSVLLLFGRLSSDGEITAMKACGISLREIARGPLLASLVFTAFCVYINNEIGPNANYARKAIVMAMSTKSPSALMDEGRWMNNFVNGISLYVGKKNRDGSLGDLRIVDKTRPETVREISAQRGVVDLAANGEDIVITLQDAIITSYGKERPETMKCSRTTMTFEKAMKKKILERRENDFSFAELFERAGKTAIYYPDLPEDKLAVTQMGLNVEIQQRLSFSVACLAFVLLGIPLGIKAHRKESSIGVAISLFLVFNFYLFIIVANSLVKLPQYRPDIIIWMPVIISVVLGSWMIKRAD